jgi:hypothetical protein
MERREEEEWSDGGVNFYRFQIHLEAEWSLIYQVLSTLRLYITLSTTHGNAMNHVLKQTLDLIEGTSTLLSFPTTLLFLLSFRVRPLLQSRLLLRSSSLS